jgi:hypothetical protein
MRYIDHKMQYHRTVLVKMYICHIQCIPLIPNKSACHSTTLFAHNWLDLTLLAPFMRPLTKGTKCTCKLSKGDFTTSDNITPEHGDVHNENKNTLYNNHLYSHFALKNERGTYGHMWVQS